MHIRVFVDDAGRTQFAPLDVSALPSGVATTTVFGLNPPGFVQDWHHAQCPMYVITLEGEMEVEIEGGRVQRFGPGDVRLAEDTHGGGHVSRVLGDRPWRFVVLMLDR